MEELIESRPFMIKPLLGAFALALLPGFFLSVEAQENEVLVRLPGPKDRHAATELPERKGEKLVAGGGLLVSFDKNRNKVIEPEELQAGMRDAFLNADSNGDGSLTALEQKDWADQLATPDETLANPVRFDPNLDRIVSEAEFFTVIEQIAESYAEPNGEIPVSSLIDKTTPPRGQAPTAAVTIKGASLSFPARSRSAGSVFFKLTKSIDHHCRKRSNGLGGLLAPRL